MYICIYVYVLTKATSHFRDTIVCTYFLDSVCAGLF